jgi:hypothetical protein
MAGKTRTKAIGGARAIRPRHDGFSEEKRERFFAEVERSGCIRDGCRAAGISKTTVERWRDKDSEFAAALALKLHLATPALERLAYDRAVTGAAETVIREGKVVATKVKPSDAMLRMLLQGACPKKYGRTAGERQASAAIRRRLKDELRAEIEEEVRGGKSHDEWFEDAMQRLDRFAKRERDKRLDDGYRPVPDDYPDQDALSLVAPGWALVREGGR